MEYARADFACEEVAGCFFSASEVSALRALGTGDYTEAFFNCWTRKEAFIKALGEGLSSPLASFSVSLTPREPAALLSVEGRAVEPSRWFLRELHPGRGYAAALVLEAIAGSLKFYRWPARPCGRIACPPLVESSCMSGYIVGFNTLACARSDGQANLNSGR